jgi:hypothetical protein
VKLVLVTIEYAIIPTTAETVARNPIITPLPQVFLPLRQLKEFIIQNNVKIIAGDTQIIYANIPLRIPSKNLQE